MRFNHDGMSLWYGTDDAPAPGDTVQEGKPIEIIIGVQPPDASNNVQLFYRINNGPMEKQLVAKFLRRDPSNNIQYFLARFPSDIISRLHDGDLVQFNVVCTCAGHQVPSPYDAKQLVSSFRIMHNEEAKAKPIRNLEEATTTTSREPHSSIVAPARKAIDNDSDKLHTDNQLKVTAADTANEEDPDYLRLSLKEASTKHNVISSNAARPLERPTEKPKHSALHDLSLVDLAKTEKLKIPNAILALLSKKYDVNTIADIRRLGGIGHLEEFQNKTRINDDDNDEENSNKELIDILESHARLSILPTDIKTNSLLISLGYTNLDKIAEEDPESFASKFDSSIEKDRAVAIHNAAIVEHSFLNNILTNIRIDRANNRSEGIAVSSEASSSAASILTTTDNSCSCKECQKATNPMAYLMDLLDYTVKHLKYKDKPVNLTLLQDSFYQPFRDLPAECELMEKQVRQVRICIEILRKYLPQPRASYIPTWYLESAYEMLLQRFGTSSEELKQIQNAPKRERIALAQKLGIPLREKQGPADIDELEAIYLAPGSITERKLEDVFGLRDTARNPFDPDPEGFILQFRKNYLYNSWRDEDWPQNPPPSSPLDALPLVDPEIIRVEDIQPMSLAMGLWKKRDQVIREIWEEMDLIIKEPTEGLNSLLLGTLQGGRTFLGNMHGVQLGKSISDLVSINDRRKRGLNISADLQALELSEEYFDTIMQIIELYQKTPQDVTQFHWETLYSILIRRWKKKQFSRWRDEEKPHLTLDPYNFILRPRATRWIALPWEITPYTPSVETRIKWQAKLRSRIEQERRIIDQVQEATDFVEDSLLQGLRDYLLGGMIGEAKKLTDALQIDFMSSSCQKTTRISQAIETIQGILFGVRNGLIDDINLTLEDVNFDQKWQWIGSYSTWRAAMLVFLYPENCLRPSLRAETSRAFQDFIYDLWSQEPISPTTAKKIVSSYNKYFIDVCSLSSVAKFANIEIARAASGKFYYRFYQPTTFSKNNYTFWEEIKDVPEKAEFVKFITYQQDPGKVSFGFYLRAWENNTQKLFFMTYKETGWSIKEEEDRPYIMALTANYTNKVIPSSKSLQKTKGINGWTTSRTDYLIPLHMRYRSDTGTEIRPVIVALAKFPDDDGKTRVGILVGSNGGLVLTDLSRIDLQGWYLPQHQQPVLVQYNIGTQCLLLLKDTGVDTQLGLLGQINPLSNDFGLLWTTIDGYVHPASTGSGQKYKVNKNSTFLSADIDGDSFSEIIAIQRNQVAGKFGSQINILHVKSNVHSEGCVFETSHDLEYIHLETPGICKFPPLVVGESFIAIKKDGVAETILVNSAEDKEFTLPQPNPCATKKHWTRYAWEIFWNKQKKKMTFYNHVAGVNSNEHVEWINQSIIYNADDSTNYPKWLLQTDDEFTPLNLDSNFGQGVVMSSPNHPDLCTLIRKSKGGPLEFAWKTTDSKIESITSSSSSNIMQGWIVKNGDSIIPGVFSRPQDAVAANAAVVHRDGSGFGILSVGSNGKISLVWSADNLVKFPDTNLENGWTLSPNSQYISIDIDNDGYDEVVTLNENGFAGVFHAIAESPPKSSSSSSLSPKVEIKSIVDRSSQLWDNKGGKRRLQIEKAYKNTPDFLIKYLDEAYYFVPIQIGLQLRENGYYDASLDWFRSVYDYRESMSERKIAHKLVLNGQSNNTILERSADWLSDPLNPHLIAETRKDSYSRFTILAIVRALIDYADSEFTRATSESIPRARELYSEALELLDMKEITQHLADCSKLIEKLELKVGEEESWSDIKRNLKKIENYSSLSSAVEEIKAIAKSEMHLEKRISAARELIEKTKQKEAMISTEKKLTMDHLMKMNETNMEKMSLAILADTTIAKKAETLGSMVSLPPALSEENSIDIDGTGGSGLPTGLTFNDHILHSDNSGFLKMPIPALSLWFCVPLNPVIEIARNRAELNLYKMRSCRNIAGMEMRVDPYANLSARDMSLEDFGSGNALPVLPRQDFHPLPYRYSTLIERAKQLVDLARQIESSMLASFEKKDSEQYAQMKARQDLSLAQAGVRLKDLQISQASDNIVLAELQRQRAQIQRDHYSDLISSGWTLNEHLGLAALWTSVGLQQLVALSHFSGSWKLWEAEQKAGLGFSAQAELFSTMSQIFSTYANYERREQEWQFSKKLASQDVKIGDQQIKIAQDGILIVTQERNISQLDVRNAEAVLDFLVTKKFGTAELYAWMSSVLEGIYRFFLQQATSMAQSSEAQLAFERQEIPPRFIQADYWEPPTSAANSNTGSSTTESSSVQQQQVAPNRRGLTGAERLLRDIVALDQYAFKTDQRKLHLTKTISLAQLDPFAFQRFRQNGMLLFSTPMELFDRDFPGHYLRLIKRVKTSVIALISPVQGIHASLSTSGRSYAVIGKDAFEKVAIQRSPESVALSSPINATGVFELDTQPELLVPFEGIGVDTEWMFSLPKSANFFDYQTIADVLLTIEYTALDSYDYRQQVIKKLDRRMSADRPFSFRQNFADQWWDLHNPDQAPQPPMTVTFETRREDFPPNVDIQKITNLTLYFVHAEAKTPFKEVSAKLSFKELDGGTSSSSATTSSPSSVVSIGGVISTRRANASSWISGPSSIVGKKPFGAWTLELPTSENFRGQLKNDEIQDILFVITYEGNTPEWPK